MSVDDRLGPAAVLAVLAWHRQGPSADARSLARRAYHLARGLGGSARAVLLGCSAAEAASFEGIADFVTVPAEVPEAGDRAPLAAFIAEIVRESTPRIILFEGTPAGNEMAGRLAARLGSGIAANCRAVDVEAGGTVVAERDVYGKRATATVAFCDDAPTVVTLEPGRVFSGPSGLVGTASAASRVERRLTGGAAAERVEVLRTWHPGPWEMEIGEAEVVVAGGRGVGTREGLALLGELAELLGGAVAGSRPLADAGLLPVSRQVGLSGRTVAPKLYIAVGISGSPHHVIGMRGSGSVIAINSDPHAPIFERADVRLVGDAHVIVADLIRRLRPSASRKPSPGDVTVAAARL